MPDLTLVLEYCKCKNILIICVQCEGCDSEAMKSDGSEISLYPVLLVPRHESLKAGFCIENLRGM